MFRVKQLAWAMGCVSLMSGCAWYQNKDGKTVDIRPVMEVRHAAASSEAMYQLGRYHQERVHYPEAIAAYEKALDADQGHVEAHNGLGVAHCLEGRHELALQYLRRAIELAPLAGHLQNNLGYAHLAHGQETQAAEAFERALRLEPQNRRARRTLAAIYERAGLHDKAAALKTARSESVESIESAKSADPAGMAAATSITASAPAPDTSFTAVSAPVAATAGEKQKLSSSAVARLVQITPGVFEFRLTETNAIKPLPTGKTIGKMAAPQVPDEPDGHGIRIEVSNGNGVVGMARQVSDFLQQNGFSRARLTDRQPYQQLRTEIHYRPGYSRLAGEISRMMPAAVPAVESYNLRRDIQLRVLLGNDIAKEAAYFESPGRIRVAQNSGE